MTLTAPPDWMFKGNCLNTTVNMWPRDGQGVILAIAVCRPPNQPPCPVLDTCRQHAIDNHEVYGVLGGLSQRERLKRWKAQRRELTQVGV